MQEKSYTFQKINKKLSKICLKMHNFLCKKSVTFQPELVFARWRKCRYSLWQKRIYLCESQCHSVKCATSRS